MIFGKISEEIKIYLRGHNLYDIFYGRYKKEETEVLTRYIDLAPRRICRYFRGDRKIYLF